MPASANRFDKIDDMHDWKKSAKEKWWSTRLRSACITVVALPYCDGSASKSTHKYVRGAHAVLKQEVERMGRTRSKFALRGKIGTMRNADYRPEPTSVAANIFTLTSTDVPGEHVLHKRELLELHEGTNAAGVPVTFALLVDAARIG